MMAAKSKCSFPVPAHLALIRSASAVISLFQVLGSAQTAHTQGFAATGALAALQEEPSADAVFTEDR